MEIVGALSALALLTVLPCLLALLIMVGAPLFDVGRRLLSRTSAPSAVEEDVQRLRALSSRLRRTSAAAVHERAVLVDAYDTTLRYVCEGVNLPHRLGELAGVELEVERLRLIEGLAQTGLSVHQTDYHFRGCQ